MCNIYRHNIHWNEIKCIRCNLNESKKINKYKRTVSVFQGLLLFGGLGDDFDPLAEEDTDVGAVAVKHLDR